MIFTYFAIVKTNRLLAKFQVRSVFIPKVTSICGTLGAYCTRFSDFLFAVCTNLQIYLFDGSYRNN